MNEEIFSLLQKETDNLLKKFILLNFVLDCHNLSKRELKDLAKNMYLANTNSNLITLFDEKNREKLLTEIFSKSNDDFKPISSNNSNSFITTKEVNNRSNINFSLSSIVENSETSSESSPHNSNMTYNIISESFQTIIPTSEEENDNMERDMQQQKEIYDSLRDFTEKEYDFMNAIYSREEEIILNRKRKKENGDFSETNTEELEKIEELEKKNKIREKKRQKIQKFNSEELKFIDKVFNIYINELSDIKNNKKKYFSEFKKYFIELNHMIPHITGTNLLYY